MSDYDVLSPRFFGAWIGLVVFVLVFKTSTPGVLGQEQEKDPDAIEGRQDPYDPIIDLRKVEYIASSATTKKKAIRFTFNVHADVPKGAKINFELEYNALPFENINFVLEGQKRRGLVFEWSPKKALAIDQYYLRVRMHLNDQTPAVKKSIERKPRKFPKALEPWPWLYFNNPVKIGTEADLLAQKNAMCDLYGKYMDRLVANFAEFQKTVDKVKAGQEAANGTKLDEKKFEKIIVAWRNKQGKLQQEIQDLVIDKPVFASNSPTAYRYLTDLGRMVSKSALRSQKEVTDQYGVAEIRPKKVHRYFNGVYRYAAGKKQLNDTLGRIENIVCAHLLVEEDAEGDPAAKDGAKKDDPKKGDAKKGDPKKGGAKKSATKKGSSKKKSSKKK